MSATDARTHTATELPGPDPLDMRVEVVVLPVTDLERSRRFYEQLGWRFDTELEAGDVRVIQFTPPGSKASVMFGTGITTAAPGTSESLVLAVHDIEASRAELARRGIDVSEVFHDPGGVFHHTGTQGRAPGPNPERRSYASWASFSDPDGNSFFLQEIRERLPGR